MAELPELPETVAGYKASFVREYALDAVRRARMEERERLQSQIDALRMALEVIAVGDSKNPVIDAGDELVALGFWRGAAVAAIRGQAEGRE